LSSCRRSTMTVVAPASDKAVGVAEVVGVLVGVLDDVSVAEAEPDEDAVSLLLGVSDAVPDPDDDGDAVAVCDADAVPVSEGDAVCVCDELPVCVALPELVCEAEPV
jgi:hypothetical protein